MGEVFSEGDRSCPVDRQIESILKIPFPDNFDLR